MSHPHDHRHPHPQKPPHEHPHAQEERHPHEHPHPHREPKSPSERGDSHPIENAQHRELTEAAGAGKLIYFDAFSGVAGDMTIAALLDLGVPLRAIEAALSCLALDGYTLEVGRVWRSSISATTFDVHVQPGQPERTYAEIDRMIEHSSLAEGTRSLARSIFRRLGEAEAEVHGIALSDVHFHEVGAVDAIVDIVGAVAALRWLGAAVTFSPLPMGHGFVESRHGVLPLPAPATVGCLRGVPTYGVDVSAELVTPTGAAIAACTAERFERWPEIVPERIGWGAGRRELPGRPNALRVVLGSRIAAEHASSERIPGPTHVVVESNVDDMTGELAAHAIEMLLRADALDAWAEPVFMKKGRPGLKIAALGRTDQAERLSQVILTETSSIGVRRTLVSRTERPRTCVEASTPFGPITVKISRGPFGPAQIKPEFDACARAAERAKVPVREVVAAALVAGRTLAEDMPLGDEETRER
jgi:pyridinium-3,5-bisthiocarboxylic acid mononucleotide nickel chelatase